MSPQPIFKPPQIRKTQEDLSTFLSTKKQSNTIKTNEKAWFAGSVVLSESETKSPHLTLTPDARPTMISKPQHYQVLYWFLGGNGDLDNDDDLDLNDDDDNDLTPGGTREDLASWMWSSSTRTIRRPLEKGVGTFDFWNEILFCVHQQSIIAIPMILTLSWLAAPRPRRKIFHISRRIQI